MTNKQLNTAFFTIIDEKTKMEILGEIAKHYGINKSEALEEVTDEEAENLLDYLTGRIRNAASAIMKRHGFSNC